MRKNKTQKNNKEKQSKLCKINNGQKGITLIALVVTIVVLLILAGVSISLVLDNNGITTKAREAKDKSYIAAIKEARTLWRTERTLDSTTDSLADYLFKQGVITEQEKNIVSNGGTITKGKYSISFVKTVAEAFADGELKVGDWVNYQNPTTVSADVKATDSNYSDTGYKSLASRTGMSTEDGYSADLDQTYSLTNNSVQVNWRVLGLSTDGRLMLTTEEPLQRDYDSSATVSESNSPYFYLRGAKGCAYNYGIAELNKICAIYKNNLADEVRSLTIDDINRLCEVTVDVAGKKVTKASDTTENIDQWSVIGKTISFTDNPYQDTEAYKSPEDYITGRGMSTGFKLTCDVYKYKGSDAIDTLSKLYVMLFNNESYWLASRSTAIWENDEIDWGNGCVTEGGAYSGCWCWFTSQGDIYADGTSFAVRPVVFLKSSVTVDDIQVIESVNEDSESDYCWDINY